MVIYMFKVDDDTFRMIIRYNISPNTRTELVIENIRILTDPDKIQALNNKDSKEDK
jgi:predicted deacetylase